MQVNVVTASANDLPTPDEWAVYRDAIEVLRARRVPFAVGGGLAVSAWTRRWRYTKDLDLYLLPRDRDAAVNVFLEAGFRDYYERLPYDRGWIFRAHQEDVIVDLIWSMANYRAEVEPSWLAGEGEITIHGTRLPLLSVEDLIWAKLYIVQRDRSDWPDILNLLYARGPDLDWVRFLDRLGPDAQVLGGVLALLRWIAPARAADLPPWVWQRVGVEPPAAVEPVHADRVRFLDSRDWFGPKD